MEQFRRYYDFPYKAHPVLANVAVVGAGTGNDVAAALRAGADTSRPLKSIRPSS